MLAFFFSFIFIFQTPDPKNLVVKLEVPIANGDLLAARDSSQVLAFELALDQALPRTMDAAERNKRLKSAIRYIKSFRVSDERRVGESLQMTYEVELQDSALEGILEQPPVSSTPAAAPVLATNTIEAPVEALSIEIVFLSPLNAAELVDQIQGQLKIPVRSFKLTRSAILLSVTPIKPAQEILNDIQTFVATKGKVNLIDRNLGLPTSGGLIAPLAAPAPSVNTVPVIPTPTHPVTPVAPTEPSTPLPSMAPPPSAPSVPEPVAPTQPPAPAPVAPQKKTFSTPSFQWQAPAPSAPVPAPVEPVVPVQPAPVPATP